MSMRRLACVVLVMLATLLFLVRTARADQVEVRASVEPATVEVGETASYVVVVMVHGRGQPTEVKPGSMNGVTLLGSAGAAPVHMRSIVNGVASEVNGLTSTWRIRADREGTFTLGPAQVVIDGAKRSVPAARVTVVGRGKAPKRNNDPFAGTPFAGGPSPLDPFKGIFDFGDDDRTPDPPAPTADPKLSMDAPRQSVAFLHAVIDKTRAVVGEQVTLAVYLYEDPYAHQGRPGDVHEPTANDFVKRSLIEDETRAVGVGTASVGGKPWTVKLVRKNALFPLKTGRLVIEPMSMTLPQARVGLRESERLVVDVGEPPVDGRPAGFAMGDVGDMSLAATVTPRTVPKDGAVGVTVELRGTGNLPSQLTLPVVPGVEWLEPQTREKLGAQSGDRFGGSRTFSYVVRLHKEGNADLGEIRLPYYDAEKRVYGVARAALGIVVVSPGGDRDAGRPAEEPEIVLAGMPKERRTLEGAHARSYVSETPFFWAAIFGSPIACALAVSAHELVRRARERRANAAPSPDRIARERRAEADVACGSAAGGKPEDARKDGAAAMGAVARAMQAAVLARTGVNLRGAALDAGESELVAAGVDAEKARAVIDVLTTCEDARFSPDGVTIDAARNAWQKGRDALDALPSGGAKE
ncbi:MAG: BatD family protein [Deltaproteobacteria bacterium]|nr:BatD family protein [Deltaproteobacteria bacterium]